MNVTLVSLHLEPSPQALPLANAYLKAYLATDEELDTRISVSLVDSMLDQPIGECVDAIVASSPAAVGFSVYLWNSDKSREIATRLRQQLPHLIIFAGGPEATAAPLRLIRESAFDFLIIGEGEIPFLESMARLNQGETCRGVRGTAWIEEGELQLTAPHPVALLSTIPSPYLNGVIQLEKYSGVLWELARGCDFGCDFCFDYKGSNGVRRFPLERIEAELDLFVRQRITQVFVLDSTFNQDMKRAKSVLRMIRKRARHIHFHFEVRSEFIDQEMARLFADITCSLQIGLQSSRPEVLKKVHRVFNPRDFSNRIALLNESGAIFGFDLIYGLPGDTLAGMIESLNFALDLYPNHLDIFPLAVLPGTSLAARAAQEGLQHQQHPPYTLTSSPTFPASDLAAAGDLAAACDIFYSRGRAVAWFKTITRATQMTPARFLGEFFSWGLKRSDSSPGLREADLADEEIWQLQREFVRYIFNLKRKVRLLPAALDLTDYHYHYGAALLSPAPEIPTDRELASRDLLATCPHLAPSARLARFHYEIYDILEAGEVELTAFADCFTATGSMAVIYPRAGEVFTESLVAPYFRLLEQLDGRTPVRSIVKKLRLQPDEAASFLEFAAAEGIITLGARH